MLYGIAAATASFLLAALLAALLRAPALRLALVDRRRQRPVPLLGGAAVVLVTGAVAWTGDRTGVVPLGSGVGRLLVAATAVGFLGLAADVWRLRRRWLLAGTALAAAYVVPYGETGPVAGGLAAGWIAVVAVAFRGLDHADGVAGTVGVVTAFGVGACAAAELMDGLAVLLLALAAALTGFLLHNWHPARIALGACGSLFAGFLLAGAAVFTRAGHEPLAGVGVAFALTALAGVDAALVLLSRRLAGRPLLRGGPDHLAHRLRRLGLTPRGAADGRGRNAAAGGRGVAAAGRRGVAAAGCGGIAAAGCGGNAASARGRVPAGRGGGGGGVAANGRGRVPEGGRRRAAPAASDGDPGVSDASRRNRDPGRGVLPGDDFPGSSDPAHREIAGQRVVARKERIRVEPARLTSVDASKCVLHT